MDFVDKTLECSDCGAKFTFSVGEQELFATKGYTNEPKRCPSCRGAKKARRYGNIGYGTRSQMFPAVCAECGIETEVPFQPQEGRPVYCSDCHSKIRLTK